MISPTATATAPAPATELDSFLPRKVSSTTKVFLAVCVPVILAAIYFAPVLMSLGWHLIHGQRVSYRGLQVTVPWGWTADLTAVKDDYPTNPQGLTLQKPPKTLNIEARGPELMYFNLLLPDAHSTVAQQATEWEQLFRESHPVADFQLTEPADLPANTHCLEAAPRASQNGMPPGAALACSSVNGGWLANYAGTQRNIPLFLSILAGIKSTN